MPAAFAIVPVSMLFGVLAHRADWSGLEILAASLLGFSGSGQFALLPLAGSNTGFLTMLMVCASINSRYVPITFTTRERLPQALLAKGFTAHMLGDEAFATEQTNDSSISIFTIRFTIFAFWVISGLIGALLSRAIPDDLLNDEIHLGFPASVVLLYLSVAQIRARMISTSSMQLLGIGTGLGVASLFYSWLGPMYFWIPSVATTTIVLSWCRSYE